MFPPRTDSCCSVLDGVATGTWAILWRDAAGTYRALEGPSGTGVDKVLHCDGNGPYWGNP